MRRGREGLGPSEIISNTTFEPMKKYTSWRRCIYNDCHDVDMFYVPALLYREEACFPVRLSEGE